MQDPEDEISEKKSLLRRLQEKDNATKQKIMIGATIVLMAVIIGLWLMYFNALTAAPTQETDQQSTGAPLWQSGTAEIGSFFGWIDDGFNNFIDIFKGPGEYDIHPKQ